MKQRKFIFAVGGTGGHVFPALALAQDLMQQEKEVEIIFVGGKLSQNRFFDKSFVHIDIDCAPLTLKNFLKVPPQLKRIWKGFVQSKQIIKDFVPDCIVGFGSFYTLPMLTAGLYLKIPFFLHEQNSFPGKVNRLFSRKALSTGITFPEATRYLYGKTISVSFPLKKEFRQQAISKSEALGYFGLTHQLPTLLVFGGSQGAQRINYLFLELLEAYPLYLSQFQIIHFTGDAALEDKCREAYKKHQIISCVKTFEKQMEFAWYAADLVISRAGAASIAEMLACEVPTLFIPYPSAADDHQNKNARYIAKIIGGGGNSPRKRCQCRAAL